MTAETTPLIVLAPAVALTSLIGVLLGVRRGLSGRALRRAGALACELLGLAAIFFAANLAVGLALVLAVRWGTDAFLSAYALQDLALLGLSLLQGLLFGLWRRGA